MACFKGVILLYLPLLFVIKLDFAHSKFSCIAIEKEALYDLRRGLVDKANRLSSWKGDNCCAWEGVGCDKRTGHVTKLDLSNHLSFDSERYFDDKDYFANFSLNCLGGEISPSLLNLRFLQSLDLSMNNFSGIEIPTFLASLKNLDYLNLSSANFGGNVPQDLGNLSNLKHLHLGYAPSVSFSFRIFVKDYGLNVDNLRWLPKLSSLKSLDLSGVQLSEAKDFLDSINKLTALDSLKLAGCNLTTFPPISHINFTSLTSLNLQWNNFNSTPLWLSNITGLRQLHLDHNSFDGLVPSSIEQLTSLTVLDLSYNSLAIPLPNSLCRLKNLVHLDLGGNYFYGTVPGCLENLTSLAILDLQANNFEGPFPDSICNLGSLQVLDLSLNQFNSSLPALFKAPSGCFLNSLKELYLVSSGIYGSLPGHLENYRYLEVLHVPFNSFSGPLPFELGRLSHLRELDVSNNKFNGSVPPSLGLLSNLTKLDISNNSLTGVLSEVHFGKLTKLKYLSVSSNSLLLEVSSQWLPPFQLQTIDLASINVGPYFPPWLQTQGSVKRLIMSNASISDTIPEWFENVYSRIDDLDLSHNNITGQLPKFVESRHSLRVIKLNSNKFEGPITTLPSEIYLLDLSENLLSGPLTLVDSLSKSFNHLRLSDNLLTGEIPLSLCDIQSLTVVDLSGNQFSGTIPSCLGNLKNMWVLDLSNNSLNGQIPSSLGFLVKLHGLHLQQNKLEGKIPSSFNNLKVLRMLDLGDNELKDIIPPWIGENLQSLAFLRLHSNNFYGGIPLQLCQLKILKLLDLAKNKLSGSIPRCVNNFSNMIFDNSQMYFNIRLLYYYGERMLESAKGMEQKYSRTLPFLRTIQLSENNISGEIPEEILDLLGLNNLNLSGNHLQGRIPQKIGRLKNLEALDLSRNELSGPIPTSLSSIYPLSHLNLSFNKLSGPIPTGNQLQTINDESIYEGNDGLCGAPLLKRCPDEKSSNGDEAVKDVDGENELVSLWFYAGLGPGFGFGFIVFCCTLIFLKSWRITLFLLLDNLFNGKRISARGRRGRPRSVSTIGDARNVVGRGIAHVIGDEEDTLNQENF